VPLIVTEVGETAQVAGSVPAFVENAQVRLTVPVNPPDGVTLTVEVLPVVAPGATLIAPLLLSAYVPTVAGAVTVTPTAGVSVVDPDVPVTVTEYAPGVVVAVVVMVSVAVCAVVPLIVTEVGATAQVAGLAAAFDVNAQLKLTGPINPPAGVTVMLEVLPVATPATTLIAPLLLSAYVPVGATAVTATSTVAVCVVDPDVPVTVTEYAPGVVAAAVVMVSVAVCAVVPLIVTEVGETAQVAGLVAAFDVNAQVRLTAPVNPPDGVTVMVEVLPVVAPATTLIAALLLKAKVLEVAAVQPLTTLDTLSDPRPVAISKPVAAL
jgi:hypothetical protein